MAVTKTLFSTTRTIPQTGERPWGEEVTSLLQDLTTGLDGVGFLLNSQATWRLYKRVEGISAGGTVTSPFGLVSLQSSGGAITLSGSRRFGL